MTPINEIDTAEVLSVTNLIQDTLLEQDVDIETAKSAMVMGAACLIALESHDETKLFQEIEEAVRQFRWLTNNFAANRKQQSILNH